jgi:Family of unknown function (DUF5677)
LSTANENTPRKILFGDDKEWEDFDRRNPEFVNRLGNLLNAIQTAFADLTLQDPIDKVLFHLNRLCAEDFSEILLLCGNGYGIGAEKLLRGMYERAVTAIYLHDNPAEVDNFLEYAKISAYKLMNATIETLGDPFPPEQKQKIKTEFDEAKPRFMIKSCSECGEKRLNHTWTKLDVVSMAKHSGALAKLLVPAYYMGVRESHSSINAIFSRLDAGAAYSGEGLIFDGSSQRKRSDSALLTAHKILLMVLDLHKNHFHLDTLEQLLLVCCEDIFVIWSKSALS